VNIKLNSLAREGLLFSKTHYFFADSIFLKSPERIESLGMMMGLLMLVYTLAQRQIRTALRESKSTVKNQLGKPTDLPTLRWIFQCFQSIHVVTLNQEKHICYWTQEREISL
jgi:transposase